MGSLALKGELPVLPVWLWPEGDLFRLWTPDETSTYTSASLRIPPERLLQGGRDRREQITVNNAFEPREFGHKLAGLLASKDRRVMLYIADDKEGKADDALHAIEWLSLSGTPVGESTIIARHVVRKAEGPAPAPKLPVYLLDLWEGDRPHPLDGLLEAVQSSSGIEGAINRIRGAKASKWFVETTDPATYAGLIIFAHGTEDSSADAVPFKDERENPWSLPVTNNLPPLVILLVCGTDCGNLVRFARTLHGPGARTVIAPFGKLDAPDSRLFLDCFLPMWLNGEPVGKALLQAKLQDKTDRGAKRLTIVGSPDLRRSDQPLLEELSDGELVLVCESGNSDQRAKAAAILAKRQTLSAFLGLEELDRAEDRLQKLMNPSLEDKRGGELFQLFDSISPEDLGLLTRIWLHPMQAHGAEKYNTGRMSYYEASRTKLLADKNLVPARAHYCWHRVHYRRGRFVPAFKECSNYLSRVSPADRGVDWARAARGIADLLIEFDLPVAALRLTEEIKQFLDSKKEHDDAVRLEEHKLRDSRARAHLRAGDDGWQAALALFERKQTAARDERKENGNRELAWLLYVTAWDNAKSDEAKSYAWEVTKILKAEDDAPNQTEAPDNRDRQYLIRSLAAYSWLANDTDTFDLLTRKYVPWLENSKPSDPGPLAFAVGFLNLHRLSKLPGSMPPRWSKYRESMFDERYFLEAAAFDALMGNRREAERAVDLFQRQKNGLATEFGDITEGFETRGPSESDLELGDLWAKESLSRSELEREILLSSIAPTPQSLLCSGLLPL